MSTAILECHAGIHFTCRQPALFNSNMECWPLKFMTADYIYGFLNSVHTA